MLTSIGSMCRSEWSTNSCRWCIIASTRNLLSTWRTAAFLSPMLPVDDIFVPPVVITWLCHDTISARTVVGHSLLLARLPGTHWVTICAIWRLALTVSDVCSRLICFPSTSAFSALEVFVLHIMCYINLRLTYLLKDVDGTYTQIDLSDSEKGDQLKNTKVVFNTSQNLYWKLTAKFLSITAVHWRAKQNTRHRSKLKIKILANLRQRYIILWLILAKL